MKADEQLKCKDCDWYGNCEYYEGRKETSQICKMFNNTWKFIAELEKIKAEIEEKESKLDFTKMSDVALKTAYVEASKLIDKHISELKNVKYYSEDFIKGFECGVERQFQCMATEIDKLPRIKVGNSNSPTVKYCIDENLIYDLFEHYEGKVSEE